MQRLEGQTQLAVGHVSPTGGRLIVRYLRGSQGRRVGDGGGTERIRGMKAEFFLFLDGPWRGQIHENTFHDHLPPSSLLIGGGPARHVRTQEHVDLSGGARAVVYHLDTLGGARVGARR